MNKGAIDISYFGLLLVIALGALPIIILFLYNKESAKKAIISIFRMAGQLFLAAFYLTFLFKYDNIWINFLWYLVMISFASHSVISNTNVKLRRFFLPVFLSIFLVNFVLISFVNKFVLDLTNIYTVKYFIVISGMLIGNSLKAIVIGIDEFYTGIKNNFYTYLFLLGNGFSFRNALFPYLRNSLTKSSAPIIASMGAVGIVHLPGMMTGQLLGGVEPLVAVKYQFFIMVLIFTSIILSVIFSILFSIKSSFNRQNILDFSIFR